MAKDRDDYTAANRAAWEASAPYHEEGAEFAGLLAGFAKPGFSCLDAVLTERLMALEVVGKDVAQICCNNGREILSVKNLAAGRCVGFDQSAPSSTRPAGSPPPVAGTTATSSRATFTRFRPPTTAPSTSC